MAPKLQARPTTYKGVLMRSRLEAGFAQWLDQWSIEWEYEPACFADETGQYLPDFRLDNVRCAWEETRFPVYVEVKPKPFDLVEFAQLARRMQIVHSTDPSALLVLVTPGHTPTLIPCRGVSGLTPRAAWTTMPDDTLGLALLIPDDLHPWVGEWWQA